MEKQQLGQQPYVDARIVEIIVPLIKEKYVRTMVGIKTDLSPV